MGIYSVVQDRLAPAKYETPFKALKDWNDHRDRVAELESLFPNKYPPLYRSPSPMKHYHEEPIYFNSPLEKALGYNYAGQPLGTTYRKPLTVRKPLTDLFEPNIHVPISRFVRDPWWWEYPELRPYSLPSSSYRPSRFYLRDSYLSPVKRTYLWGHHPIRPLGAHYY